MILGTLIGPQVYQFSDLLSVHLAVSLFLLHFLLLLFFYYYLSKNCFLAVDLARLYQGTTNLGQNRWKNKIALPTPNQGQKKTWCILLLFLRFSTIVSARMFFRLWTWPGIRRLHILDKTGGKLDPPPPPPVKDEAFLDRGRGVPSLNVKSSHFTY